MPQPGRGPGPGARAGRLLLLLAVLLALAIPATPAGATGNPYRVRHFELADVPYGRLSYTGEPVPALPHPRPRDSQGVPLYRGHDGTLHYRPGQIAINGMKRVDAYLDHGYKAQLDQALVQAARLRELAIVEREAWWLPFTFDYPPEGQKAPWFNAMAQGLALSYFARLYVVTGDEVHLDAARWVFRSFRRLGRWRRPWVAYADPNRYLWLEHYPSSRADHVLNAHLHAVFGLYEYWGVAPTPRSRRVLGGAITTMRDHAWRYRRRGGLSLYCLYHRTRIEKYHEVHIWQLRLLGRLSGDRYFIRLAARLKEDVAPDGYVPGRPARP